MSYDNWLLRQPGGPHDGGEVECPNCGAEDAWGTTAYIVCPHCDYDSREDDGPDPDDMRDQEFYERVCFGHDDRED